MFSNVGDSNNQHFPQMLRLKSRTNLCYYVGSAYDLINPILNTDCRHLVCVDLIDDYFYPLLHEAALVEQTLDETTRTKIHLISVLNRLTSQWQQLRDKQLCFKEGVNYVDEQVSRTAFGPLTLLSMVDNISGISTRRTAIPKGSFTVQLFYEGIPRLITFYSGVSDKHFHPPELENGVDIMYISMALPDDETIKRLAPAHIIMWHTVKSPYLSSLRYQKRKGVRICPWNENINKDYLRYSEIPFEVHTFPMVGSKRKRASSVTGDKRKRSFAISSWDAWVDGTD